LRRVFVELPGWLFDADTHFHWIYLVSSVLLGAWAVRRHFPERHGRTLALLLPRAIYLHPSAVRDCKLPLLNRCHLPHCWCGCCSTAD
jgi:hypothetical protein